MKLYVDLETLQLIEAPGFRNPVTALRFKRGDAAWLDVSFLSAGLTPSSIGDPAALEMTFGVKLRNAYASDYLVHATDWTIPAAGEAQVYRCNPSFNTEALDSELGIGSGTELSEINLMGEITWREGAGGPTSTRTFYVVVENDVNRGTEGTPLTLPTPDEWLESKYFPRAIAVSGITAGADNGIYVFDSFTANGKPKYVLGSSYVDTGALDTSTWKIVGSGGNAFFSTGVYATPDLVPSWTPIMGTGSPLVESADITTGDSIRAAGAVIAGEPLVISGYTESSLAFGVVTVTAILSIASGTYLTATLSSGTPCWFTMPPVGLGKSFVLLLKQGATGGGTATFTDVRWDDNGAPTMTPTAYAMDILTFTSDGDHWYGSCSQGFDATPPA